ncbi:PREDICTED: bifunctional epoxide hydrolase 2-like [Tarenaya hassleriana]|uniref:bifunctional epoxide hydrolase 2-like n=1 Tax=Tarenaya hassleriana TaxID=28532 RepID=UPI00053C8B7B|nr:PREDICTED: bifunctional epoxide hydrolase 2-like [Tarenaya hassleriana]
MEGVEHRMVRGIGGYIHLAVKGPDDGAVVLLIHGFPELWYSWRHQISGLAALGFRAVALDLRGYGDSQAPPEISSYSAMQVVGDLVAVISAVTASDDEKVFVVGHDWGAVMAWYLCLFRPDKVKALVNLSVPFTLKPTDPSPAVKPVEMLRAFYGDDYYISRFQEPGAIEAEFAEVGTERVLKRFFTFRTPGPLIIPEDKSFWGHPDTPIPLPSWLSEEDVRYYVSKFEKTGFSGAVNFYRNLDRNYELLGPWIGSKITVPTKFIVGDLDLVYHRPGMKEYINGPQFKEDVPLLEPPVIMEGVAHWINQEKPDEILHHITDFINKF